ncbi:MAG: hypothetical protein KKB21_04340, partial [Nanoarchaeota archaeon]|nr:hypothetical protein [Nanoarchaeota archaeon]
MILKRGVVFCIAFLLLFGFYVRNVDATLGLTPALVEINFQPSYNFSVNFGALGAAPDQKLKVYAKGDFAEYVHFDKTEMTGAGGFTAYVNLPSQADKPGKNRLYIRVEEVNDNSGGVGTRIVIGALIAIYVPYPGKYAEISLTTKDVNEGESVPVTLEVSNLGKEDIFVNPVLEIYKYDNTRIDLMNLGLRSARTQAKEKFETQINTKNYKPGVYTAFASVDYGGSEIARANSTFRIGTLSVAVVNWTSMFKKGKISKFDIEIESLW